MALMYLLNATEPGTSLGAMSTEIKLEIIGEVSGSSAIAIATFAPLEVLKNRRHFAV
jgi:hypothetical protein